jgi:protein-tyrosine-phosphatase
MKTKKILFVCKHNRFRSKTAEAFFNKFNKNKRYSCASAGLLPGGYPLDNLQTKVAKEFGIKLFGKPKPITTKLLRSIDLIVIVADNVPPDLFEDKIYGINIEVWGIGDVVLHTKEEIRKIISNIRDEVIHFVERLK